MEVILKKDIEKLGFENEIISVKNGYGRNYLIPNGLAILANVSSKRMLEETLKQRAHKEEKLVNEAESIAEKLEKTVISVATKAGEKGKIEFKGLEKYLNEGKHEIKVQYKGAQNAMPYTMAIDYNTTLPKSAEQCNVDVSAKLSTKTCKVGETVRLTTKVNNKHDKGMPMTMAVVGIPSGLSAQPWQLKELQEKGTIGFYEITDNYVIFYFRDMAPNAAHTINLDLKAEVPGVYEAPASSGYLYYTNEYKCWSTTGKIRIEK